MVKKKIQKGTAVRKNERFLWIACNGRIMQLKMEMKMQKEDKTLDDERR